MDATNWIANSALNNLLFQYQLRDLNYVELPCPFQSFSAIINQKVFSKVQPLLPVNVLYTAYKYLAVQ